MKVKASTHYKVKCFDKFGRFKWREEFDNLVTIAGLNKLLDATFVTGLTSPEWWVGLVGVTHTFVAEDTLSSHTGWAENAHYSGNRKTLTLGAISGGSVNNIASKAIFTMAGTSNPDTINGCFLCDAETGTSGTLYGEGDFSIPRILIDGDIVNVEIILQNTAA